MATLGEWLHARNDAVPVTLREELDACVASHVHTHDNILGALSVAATTQMARIRDRSGTTRDDARALLTADALVTYTLERAASQGVPDLEAFAGGLLHALAGSASA